MSFEKLSPHRQILGIWQPLSHVREQLEICVELQDHMSDGQAVHQTFIKAVREEQVSFLGGFYLGDCFSNFFLIFCLMKNTTLLLGYKDVILM